MKKSHSSIGALIVSILALGISARSITTQGKHPTAVVGIFDSRAVAVAFVRSELFDNRLQALRKQLSTAATAKDAQTVKRLKEMGPTIQQAVQKQAFSAEPIDNIIDMIKDKLPMIAKQAGVDILVSRWVVAYHSPKAKFVDVTRHMVDHFKPDDATKKIIADLLATKPIRQNEKGNAKHPAKRKPANQGQR